VQVEDEPEPACPPKSYPPAPARLSDRIEGEIYETSSPSGKLVPGKWKGRYFHCTCDCAVCPGGKQFSKCKARNLSNSYQGQSLAAGRAERVVHASPTPQAATGGLTDAEKQSLMKVKCILPPDHHHGEIKVLGDGRWDVEMGKREEWLAGGRDGGNPFPLRAGACWTIRKSGLHAKVVNRDYVLIHVEITVGAGGTPVFYARDFQAGVFGKRFSNGSLAGLERDWLTQPSKFEEEGRDRKLDGRRFIGLSSEPFGAYVRSITDGFGAEDSRLGPRGPYNSEVGDRQMARRKGVLFDNVEEAFRKAVGQGGNLEEALELLLSSRRFDATYGRVMAKKFFEDNKGMLAGLVDRYKTTTEKEEQRYILSLVVPHYTYEETGHMFGCSTRQCKQASVASRMRDVPPDPRHVVRVNRYSKATVEHMEAFALRDDNVMMQAFSDGSSARVLRRVSRRWLWVKYSKECRRLHVKPMCRSSFYKYMSNGIFKDVKRQTCCCAQCLRYGDESFDILRDLVGTCFGAKKPEVLKKYQQDLASLETFYKTQYRDMLCVSSSEARLCMQYALSNPNDECLRHVCTHEHVDNCSSLKAAGSLFSALRADIDSLPWDDARDKRDALISLDDATKSIFRSVPLLKMHSSFCFVCALFLCAFVCVLFCVLSCAFFLCAFVCIFFVRSTPLKKNLGQRFAG
jgi:hypothetical protein